MEELEDSAFVVGVESREDYPGRFFMVFALRDAILMGGILLGIPPARISEKRKLLILEADDTDAFSEIANQVIGSFNSVFQPCLPSKVHLKQLPPTKFVPQMDEITADSPLPDGEYLVYKAQIRLKGEEMNRFDILVPIPLAVLFDPQETVKEQACDEAESVGDQAESLRKLFPSDAGEQGEPTASVQPGSAACSHKILIIDDDTRDLDRVREFLAQSGFIPITSHFGVDLGKVFAEEGIGAVVLGASKTEEWELTLCRRIREQSPDPGIPIFMCAPQWTRTGVLKAVKNGAREIMLKPCEKNELLAKLDKYFGAP
jgi:CheY-like chemotaxis protein